MTNELKNKKMDLAEMKNVSGGTVNEFEDLVTTLASNGLLKAAGKISSHLPIGNEESAKLVTGVLAKYGIAANIDLGWAGTGIGSEKNTYVNMETNERMSHKEVLDYIKTNIRVK